MAGPAASRPTASVPCRSIRRWCCGISPGYPQAFLDAQHFAIHVLTAEQQHLAEHFARTDHTRYNGIEHRISAQKVPIIPGVLARFDCRTHEIHGGGDHYIIVGEVEAHTAADGAPLLFFAGEYNTS
jgi:flavin reductase (DIM6/NTAB) family NADH-FMN oxidoreductase RutF